MSDEGYEAPLMSPPAAAVPSVVVGDHVDHRMEALRLLFPRLGRARSASNEPSPGENVSPAVTNARRCLFPGPRPSPAEVNALIDEELAREREEAKRKWNFDFEKLEPLPGRYLWEPVFTVDLNVEGSRTDMYDDPVVFGDVGEVSVGRQRTTRRRHVVDETVITPTVGGAVPSSSGVDDDRLTSSVSHEEGASSANDDGVEQSADVLSPSGRSRQSRITGKPF
jgi:hypothetical protein